MHMEMEMEMEMDMDMEMEILMEMQMQMELEMEMHIADGDGDADGDGAGHGGATRCSKTRSQRDIHSSETLARTSESRLMRELRSNSELVIALIVDAPS